MGEQFAELFMIGLILRLLGQGERGQRRFMGGAEQDHREGPAAGRGYGLPVFRDDAIEGADTCAEGEVHRSLDELLLTRRKRPLDEALYQQDSRRGLTEHARRVEDLGSRLGDASGKSAERACEEGFPGRGPAQLAE